MGGNVKKSSVKEVVRDYQAKGKEAWRRPYKDVRKFGVDTVSFYNTGINQSSNIEIGDNVYVLHSGFKTYPYSTCLDKMLNGKVVVYVKKIETDDTFDDYTANVVNSRTFVSNVQTVYGSFYEKLAGMNTFSVKFSDVWIPVSSASASTPSDLSSYFCREYNNTYINCEYSKATHNIVDFSNFDGTRNDTVSSQMYKPCFCCLVKLKYKMCVEAGDGVKIEYGDGTNGT